MSESQTMKANIELTQRKLLKRVIGEDSNIGNDFSAKLLKGELFCKWILK